MQLKEAIHPLLASLMPIVASLAKALGDHAEVVLHDLGHPRDSVIAISGEVTGRKVGAPLTDLVLGLLRQGKTDEDLINYPSRTADGKLLRSSTIFIRDEEGKVIGCLCINFDITRLTIAKQAIENLCQTEPVSAAPGETFAKDVEAILNSSIEAAITQEGMPVVMMKKRDKLTVVRNLDERGIFVVKGAVASAARALDVSRYTVYNYLEETRARKAQE